MTKRADTELNTMMFLRMPWRVSVPLLTEPADAVSEPHGGKSGCGAERGQRIGPQLPDGNLNCAMNHLPLLLSLRANPGRAAGNVVAQICAYICSSTHSLPHGAGSLCGAATWRTPSHAGRMV